MDADPPEAQALDTEDDDVGPDGGPSGLGGPHAFVADLDRPVLEDADHRHLQRVLRLRPGDPVTISDGAGRWRPARFTATGPVEPSGHIRSLPPVTPAVGVGFALVKGGRPEWVVQKLTELGVDAVHPFVADRSVVRWDTAKAATQRDRWARVAREAAMQCRRCRLPEISPVTSFRDVAARPGACLADRASGTIAAGGLGPPSLHRPLILVGPEGGWSDAERHAGLASVVLGPHVLRTETAAMVAGALLVARRALRW